MKYYNVYLICAEINDEKLYKIGYTKRKVNQRVKELKTGNAANFEIIDSFYSKWGTKIEASLHKRFNDKKIKGEWFNLTNKDVLNFKSNCQLLHENFNTLSNTTYYKEYGRI